MRYFVLAALVLVGCATPYQSRGLRGGYDERPIGASSFMVHVRVNRLTSSGQALEYLHRRAQELCEGRGFGSYVIEDKDTAEDDLGRKRISALVQCHN